MISVSARRLARLLVGLSLYGAFIELVQAIPALNRDSDVKDWIADTIAAGAVLLLVALWRRRLPDKVESNGTSD